MKFNGNLFYFLGAFYLVAGVGYAIWFNAVNPNPDGSFHLEVIATAAILMLAIMSVFLAFYLKMTNKKQGPVPEDVETANIEDGDFEQGYFSPWSWWPFLIGAFGAIVFLSLAVGWWLFFIGFPLALVALIGFVFERSRGQLAH
jgi:ribose/xylose/arabinose/galactoside ABC-type transport system permease subunit